MLILGLAIVFLGGLGGNIVAILRVKKKDEWDDKFGWWFGVILSAILLFAMVVIVPCVYAGNIEHAAKLKAFSEANMQNYASAITETRAILSTQEFADKVVAGSLEKTDVGLGLSERIAEWRDAVNQYNLEVAVLQRSRTIWLYPGFLVVPPEVNDLKLLTIEE